MMTLHIELPNTLERKLYREAQRRQRTLEQVVVDILTHAFAEDPTPSVSEVVARIKAAPPNPAMVTQPQGSLADALRNGPTDTSFDLRAWEAEWERAEKELKRVNLLDDIAEGRA
ncbi:MAG: hypothetical protein R2911_10460 [Caldilineaceae bacterium]